MKEISLTKPVTVGSRTIEKLTFADPKVRHILAADGFDPSSRACVVALAASLANEPEQIIKELEPEDWVKVHLEVKQIYSLFVGAGRVDIIKGIAVELSPEEFRDLIEAYAKVYELKPQQLLPVPTKEAV